MWCLSRSRSSTMTLLSPPESSLGGRQPSSQARMVGGALFLNPQGPEPGEKWKGGLPAQWQAIVYQVLGLAEPRADGRHRPAQIRKWRVGRVQTPEPSAQRRGVGHAIGIFD